MLSNDKFNVRWKVGSSLNERMSEGFERDAAILWWTIDRKKKKSSNAPALNESVTARFAHFNLSTALVLYTFSQYTSLTSNFPFVQIACLIWTSFYASELASRRNPGSSTQHIVQYPPLPSRNQVKRKWDCCKWEWRHATYHWQSWPCHNNLPWISKKI
jgi:hypothetical protein